MGLLQPKQPWLPPSSSGLEHKGSVQAAVSLLLEPPWLTIFPRIETSSLSLPPCFTLFFFGILLFRIIFISPNPFSRQWLSWYHKLQYLAPITEKILPPKFRPVPSSGLYLYFQLHIWSTLLTEIFVAPLRAAAPALLYSPWHENPFPCCWFRKTPF